jgi:hypothetical protein
MNTLGHTFMGVSSPETFDMHLYTPLAASGEIRLLYLEPGAPEQVIKCSIKNVKTNVSLHYFALSYMWGPIVTKPIQLNGQEYVVRENLWHALLRLRNMGKSIPFWIDAICINQDDESERNHQVSQMSTIYSEAICVLVWLGLGEAASSEAINMLNQLGGDSPTSEDYSSEYEISILDELATAKGNQRLLTILSLCRQAYWTRLWIIQEILMAKDIIVFTGTEKLEWESFKYIFNGLLDRSTATLRPYDDISGEERKISMSIMTSIPAKLCQEQSRRSVDKPVGNCKPLLLLCSEYGEADCADVRDKIYGLHSLAPTCCRMFVTIDYSLPLWQVYRSLLHHHIHQHSDDQLPEKVVSIFENLHRNLDVGVEHLRAHQAPPVDWQQSETLSNCGSSPCKCTITALGHVDTRFWYISHPLNADFNCSKEAQAVVAHQEWPEWEDHGFPDIEHSPLEMFTQALDDIKKPIPGLDTTEISLAIDFEGRMYLVPSIVRPDDLLCKFHSSKILLAARHEREDDLMSSGDQSKMSELEFGQQCESSVIGRAIEYPIHFPIPGEATLELASPLALARGSDIGSHYVSLRLDTQALRTLAIV